MGVLSELLISNNIIIGNHAVSSGHQGGGIFIGPGAAPIVRNNIIEGNSSEASLGGGINVMSGSGRIENNVITNNWAGNGGGILSHTSDCIIESNIILSNIAGTDGGGILTWSRDTTLISGNWIYENYAGHRGGGIMTGSQSWAQIVNNIIWQNEAGNGGGIFVYSSYTNTPVSIINCTITQNFASNDNSASGVYIDQPPYVRIGNSIIWGNYGDDLYGAVATYSDIGTGDIYGEGNISTDPIFFNPSIGDFHLSFNSPCIDTADNNLVGLPIVDADGNPRIQDGNDDGLVLVDMGAYEFWISNSPPVVITGGPYAGDEGAQIVFDGSASYDPEGEPLQYRWDFNNDGTWDTEWSSDPTAVNTWIDDYAGTVVLEVSDGVLVDQDVTTVVILNVAPTITSLSAQTDPVNIDTPVELTASFTDPGILDIQTYDVDWGDATTTFGTATGYTIDESHLYAQTGVYTITLTITDDDGGSHTKVIEHYVVVYDPEGGFVTGGGWIISPEGAYADDPTLTGKATFGFVSKYKKGQNTPSGNTEFQFKAGDLNFHSTSYDWLVITGSSYAKYKGTGTINSEGEYKFIIWAGDRDFDTFRIKIWTEDEYGVETAIYDNGSNQAIGGGSITVHNK